MSFRTILVPLALIVTAQAFAGVPTWGQLADVTILNSIPHEIRVDVNFVGGCGGCDAQFFGPVERGKTWPAQDRGDCLVTSVCASIMKGTDTAVSKPDQDCGQSGRGKGNPFECQPFRGLARGSFSIARAFAVVTDVTTRKAGYPAGCKVVQLRGVG